MAILVTGSAGFIGSNLARRLVEMGEDVVALVHASPPVSLQDILDKLKLAKGDITDLKEIMEIIKSYDVEYIFHIAAMLSAQCENAPVKCVDVNIQGMMNLLEAIRLTDVKRIIFTSTAGVFTKGSLYLDDDTPKYPFHSMYGAAKLFDELAGLWYSGKYGLDFRSVRFATVYGYGRTTGSDAFCSQFIQKVALGQPAEIPIPDFKSDWLYVKDAANSLILLFNAEQSKVKKRIYNIGGGIYSIIEAVDIVKKLIPNANIRMVQGAGVYPFQKKSFDDAYAREEIGWAPSYSLEEGIKDLINETRKRELVG